MHRFVAVIILLCIALLMLVSVLTGPSPSVPTLAITPTLALYAPLIANPFPPTATATTPPATATATIPPATATPTNLPPTFNGCQEDPLAGSAPNWPIRIVAINKDAETVTLQNLSTSFVSIDVWHMCSIKGNQEHSPIGGTLAPGEARSFGHTGGPIWNNIERDDGALYNTAGSLISYHVDQ